MKVLGSVIGLSFVLQAASAFFFDSGHHQQQQQQQQQRDGNSYQQRFFDINCPHYVCPGTLECVRKQSDCSCPYPNSQLKCNLPNGQAICISKPATHDARLSDIYDDPVKGPAQRTDGLRDCGWVLDVYEGKRK
ncbi:unnamed protein product [Kluyveromyces dobzhanskii CBS 2104]|uniref:Long chronological lifespan protein 2 n=1 Tax=Kluyveromyces dobzhanskii CBS 2104 TaxID=1427455 RepID=A0A0A8LD91_9SACH|nr:unnamed protein product [Kluyveromyces dobzhanskii CBS 2104]